MQPLSDFSAKKQELQREIFEVCFSSLAVTYSFIYFIFFCALEIIIFFLPALIRFSEHSMRRAAGCFRQRKEFCLCPPPQQTKRSSWLSARPGSAPFSWTSWIGAVDRWRWAPALLIAQHDALLKNVADY